MLKVDARIGYFVTFKFRHEPCLFPLAGSHSLGRYTGLVGS